MSDHALFAVAPYVAVVILLGGAIVRLASPNDRSAAEIREAGFRAPVTARLFLLAAILVAIAHVVTLAAPRLVLAWNHVLPREIAIELLLFACALVLCAGVGRAVADAIAKRSIADACFLGALAVAVASGAAISVFYRWASTWSAVTLSPYVASLFALQADARLVAPLPYLVKLHVFSAFAVAALFPFGHWGAAVVNALRHLVSAALTPARHAFGTRWRAWGTWAIASGRHLMWPEDDRDD